MIRTRLTEILLQGSLKTMYAISSVGCIPFGYKFGGKEQPDYLKPLPNIKQYKIFGIACAINAALLIIYLYYEAICGTVTTFEFVMILAFNASFICMSACQWFFIYSPTEVLGRHIINASLTLRHEKQFELTRGYKILCFVASYLSVVYPWMYYPSLIVISEYMPRLFRLLRQLSYSWGGHGSLAYVIQYTVIFVFATGVGHSVACFGIVVHWFSIHHYTIIQSLQGLQSSFHRVNLESVSNTYNKLVLLSALFDETFGVVFSLMYHALLIVSIVLTYITLNYFVLPKALVVPFACAAIAASTIGHFLFKLSTESNLISKKLISRIRAKTRAKRDYAYLSWRAKAPVYVHVKPFFRFESSEFLLVIWGDIVIKSIIDLFLTL
jgi:hypothetical protein